ncbi:MAG TPA: HAMP domain-containing sensor histidine kinase [Polyangiaceae bacterium]|nr:HAMP domain-containing sensor histidine kinase [Polyangiaceae bacterium]
MARRPLRLSTRLALSHGVLVALLLVSALVTNQGLLRMVGLITEIRDGHLLTVDAEEEVHRSGWRVELALRHGETNCGAGADEAGVRAAVAEARAGLVDALARHGAQAPPVLRDAARRYLGMADAALGPDTCRYLGAPSTDRLRAELDEELTDVWIDRLHVLHSDINALEDTARTIGVVSAGTGFGVALFAAVAALVIARSTARSVSHPIAALASAATRVGGGDFAPIPRVSGPLEVEELWRDLERARERLLEIDQLKQGFLAGVSHELRSPLARLREALALLSDGTCGPLSPQQARVLGVAVRACDREVRIVDGLLDMTRLQFGLPFKREAACDVDRVVEAALGDEAPEAAERGVALESEKAGAAPTLVIDSALVERAVANLVRNAVSASPRGKAVRVRREVVGAPGAPERVRIEVRDEGPGVAPEVRARLFQPFASAPVRGAARRDGIGLGLSLAREVARAHGGDLTLERSGEGGTTFRLELPVNANANANSKEGK